MTSTNKLAEKVRVSLKYEEAKRRYVTYYVKITLTVHAHDGSFAVISSCLVLGPTKKCFFIIALVLLLCLSICYNIYDS